MMDLTKPWFEYTFVAFDTETTGAYPICDELCEFGAVKWKQGQIVDKLNFLIKPSQIMSSEVIAIHGITNEMVVTAESVGAKIKEIHNFINGNVCIAHHAPFDMGFVGLEFERAGLPLPAEPALCSSLLSRNLFKDAPNHKLQTLIQYFKLEQGQAHRGYDDALASLNVALKCFEKKSTPEQPTTLEKLIKVQGKKLYWKDYSLLSKIEDPVWGPLFEACKQKKQIEIMYEGGSIRDAFRPIIPQGIVRNPDGDFVSAFCLLNQQKKRFFIEKIKKVRVL